MKRKIRHKASQAGYACFLLLTFMFIVSVAGTGCSETTQSENTEPSEQKLSKPEREDPNETDDTTINIQTEVGQNFLIKLSSNPTTGYSWQLLSLPPDSIHLQNKTYKENRQPQTSANSVEPEIVGAGGFEIWTFRALKKDTVELLFEYRQPWEKKVPAEDKKIVKIEIRDAEKSDN